MTLHNEQNLFDYLRERRSTPVAQIKGPGPGDDELKSILTLATRVPDHGKITPWRLIVYRGDVRGRLGKRFLEIALAKSSDMTDAAKSAELNRFTRAPLVIGVISTAAAHEKIPEWEQVLSAGAFCFNLILAAESHGYVANWRTEWISYDDEALQALGVKAGERVAGFIHIGSSDFPVPERVRPALADMVSYYGESAG